LSISYDFDLATLLSSSSYIELDKFIQLSEFADSLAVIDLEILSKDQDTNIEILSQEFRLTSNESESLNWTIGAFYREEDVIKDDGDIDALVLDGALLLAPLIPAQVLKNTSESWAIFADTSYELTDKLEVGAGIRYFEDDRTTVEEASNTVFSDTFDAITTRAYIAYNFSDDLTLYGNVSEGFRSGGFNSKSSIDGGAPVDYQPEEIISFELGAKSMLLDNRLTLDAAIFYSEYSDIQIRGAAGGGITAVFTGNAGEAEMKGIEWQLRWALTDSLTFNFSGDVIDTEITSLGDVINTDVVVGDLISFVPDYSFSLGMDYSFQWISGEPSFIHLQYNHQGEASTTLRSASLVSPVDVSPEIAFLNASVSVDFGSWSVEIFGRNLLDEDEKLSPGISSWWPQARPRTVGLRLGMDF